MSFLQTFIKQAHNSEKKVILIGLGDQLEAGQILMTAVQKVALETHARIIAVAHPQIITRLEELLGEFYETVDLYATSTPYDFMIGSLFMPTPFKTVRGVEISQIHAIIRGGLSSSKFLKKLRKYYAENLDPVPEIDSDLITYRLALLETASKFQFFYGGVGIDEINEYLDKKNLTTQAIEFLLSQQIPPKVGLLSGGRLSDIGRNEWIDNNIEQTVNLQKKIESAYPNIEVYHQEILIEKAIQEENNLIIAPEGIAGNLVYRTLIHLGAGRSYGAIYLPFYNYHGKIVIDTSRVAPGFEIEGALFFALGLKSKNLRKNSNQ